MASDHGTIDQSIDRSIDRPARRRNNAQTCKQTNNNNRRQAAAVNQYGRGEVDYLDVVENKKWSAMGVLLVVLGLVSAAFSVLFSAWSDEEENEAGETGKSR